jgi:hypothetical protein
MKRFKSAGQALRFLSAHGAINNLSRLRRITALPINIELLGQSLRHLGRGHRHRGGGRVTPDTADRTHLLCRVNRIRCFLFVIFYNIGRYGQLRLDLAQLA